VELLRFLERAQQTPTGHTIGNRPSTDT
jgi:hypothetical protein